MNRKTTAGAAIVLGALVLPFMARSHHSPAEYDQTQVVELQGEIVDVFWGNPHVLLQLLTVDGNGMQSTWELEGAAISSQRRRGVTPDLIDVGDQVRVAGFSSTRREYHLLAEHVLLPDGVELLLGSAREPRWSDTELGSSAWTVDPIKASTAEATGIFRVWSRGAGLWPWYFGELDEFRLTETARAVAAEFDPFEDNPLLDCTAPGMPALMGNPYPMEFVAVDGGIEMHHEEFDVVRMIHIGEGVTADGQPLSPLGYSVGEWQGSTLVVATSAINWPHFGRIGIPQTEAVEVVERFTVTDTDDRLDYELTITDPGTLLEPFTWQAFWVWRPGEEVSQYQCTVAE